MEPARAISPVTSKVREEEESSDSDSEFYDAVSVIDELKGQTNHNTGHTSMTKTNNPDPHKDAINDSGFNEEGEFFEPTSGKLEHVITTGDGKNKTSLREDTNPTETERDDTPLSEGGSKTRCSYWNPHHNYYKAKISGINKDDQSSSDEEED